MKKLILMFFIAFLGTQTLSAQQITIDNVSDLLIDARITKSNSSKENIHHFQLVESKKSKRCLVLVKLYNDGNLLLGADDIYLNIILYISEQGKRMYWYQPSANQEDFQYDFITYPNKDYVFSYYSSAVGYTELIILSSHGKLLRSSKIDEGKVLDLNSINTSSQNLKVSVGEKSEVINLKLIDWILF